jgi:CBS domain-containing protein
MAKLLRNSSRPVVSVQEKTTVEDAVKTMVKHRIGAVIVLDGDEMRGIFSERDVLDKIVLARRDPEVVGMVSLRHVMEERIADLEHEVNALEAYLGYDGVSG